jgi:hypothetical protein
MANSGFTGTTVPALGSNKTLSMGMINPRYAELKITLINENVKNLTSLRVRRGAYDKILRYIFIRLKIRKGAAGYSTAKLMKL